MTDHKNISRKEDYVKINQFKTMYHESKTLTVDENDGLMEMYK